MLKRLFSLMAAVALAAAIAFYLVVPETGDGEAPLAAQQEEGAAPADEASDTATVETETESGRDRESSASFDDGGEPRDTARLPSPVQEVPPPRIEPVKLADLPFDAQCGLQLSRVAEDPILFASGVSLDPSAGGPAAMRVDGELLLLTRTGVDGEPIGFGQFTRQIYRDETDAVQVVLDLTVEPSEYTNRSAMTRGRLVVMKPGRSTAALEVSGSAGC